MIFFFKQKTAYEMRISDWSSDVCSSDLERSHARAPLHARTAGRQLAGGCGAGCSSSTCMDGSPASGRASAKQKGGDMKDTPWQHVRVTCHSCGKVNTFALFNPSSISPEEFLLCSRSEEHTSELQSLMRI